MDAVAPSVAEGFDLLGFAGDVFGFPVFDVAAGGRPLKIAVELDAVGGIEVDTLHFTAQSFAFGEGGHDLEAVAKDHAVRPVLVVLVELGLCVFLLFGQAVEVCEEVGLVAGFFGGDFLGFAQEVVDEDLGVDLFLDVEGRGADNEVCLVSSFPRQTN